MDVKYQCIGCGEVLAVERSFLGGVDRPDPAMKVRCPFCGQACAPAEWLENLRDALGHSHDELEMRWSRCPNAPRCAPLDQYDGQCEEGRLMQKCLVSVHSALEAIFLSCPESPRPAPTPWGGKAKPDRSGH